MYCKYPLTIRQFKNLKRKTGQRKLKILYIRENGICCYCGCKCYLYKDLAKKYGYDNVKIKGTDIIYFDNGWHTIPQATVEHTLDFLDPYVNFLENLKLSCNTCNNERSN